MLADWESPLLQDGEDVNEMARSCGKQVNDYLRLNSTSEFLAALESDTGIPVSLLLNINRSGEYAGRGTWAHPEVAIDFAQWVSVEFRIWANRTLRQVIESRPTVPSHEPEFWQLIDGAIARNLEPEQVIGLYQRYNATITGKRAKAKAAKPLVSLESRIVELSQRRGWIRARDVMHFTPTAHRSPAKEIRDKFRALAEEGRGEIAGEGIRLKFRYSQCDRSS